MVKHVAIIGCVILSLSAALIVPTSCSPIGKNEQKETRNLEKSRLKRSTYSPTISYPQTTVTSSSSSSSSAAANSEVGSELALLKLLPFLSQYKYPSVVNSGGYDFNGLAGLLQGLAPALSKLLYPLTGSLGSIVGGLSNPVDKLVGGLGKTLPILNPILNPTGDVLSGLLGMKVPTSTSTAAKPTSIASLLSILPLLETTNTRSSANSASKSEATVTQG